MSGLTPRKWPRQARAKVTFDALLEALARLLAERPLAEITTNHIAARAGVSVGSLYEFFPNREAILAVLVERRLEALHAHVSEGLASVADREPWEAIRFVLARIVRRVTADRALFRVLLREAPFLRELPGTRRALGAIFGLGTAPGVSRPEGATPADRALDSGLVGRMLAGAVLDIALREETKRSRSAETEELALLAHRMLLGCDPPGRSDGSMPGARVERRRRAGAARDSGPRRG